MNTEPRATYRVQLSEDFTLQDAAGLLDYLADLGVSHLYCSPYLQAAPGSAHGYDLANPARVDESRGGESGHHDLVAEHETQPVNQLLDVVSNHMATSATNPWWWDVLENGPTSPYAAYFDIAWDRLEGTRESVILLPILDDHYGRVVEAGKIELVLDGERFSLAVYDRRLPVDPRSVSVPLTRAAAGAGSEPLAYIAGAFARLPQATAQDAESARQRSRDTRVLYALLGQLREASPEIESHIQKAVEQINRDPDKLDALLALQNYRLAYWRLAESEVGYRRFFDITSLVGLHVQNEQVLRDVHARIHPWLDEPWLDGVRIDHIDGLRNPRQYLERLNADHPDAWILVEKILAGDETLPEDWPVAGTTGYDFLNRANGLFIDPEGEELLTGFYAQFTGVEAPYDELARRMKFQAMEEVLSGDVNRLAALFSDVCTRHRRYRDFTHGQHRRILMEVAASMPIYRTYVTPEDSGDVDPQDAAAISRAVEGAREHSPELDGEVFDFVRDLLLLRVPGEKETELAMRFQQFTGPVMAKGVEDTAFYVYNRLIALNEVGGNPGHFGTTPAAFHEACAVTLARWPRALLATSTHDTKRSEDVRARIDVLTEMPEHWIQAVKRWSKMNEGARRDDAPSRNDEYLLYQTLVGAWPIEEDRIRSYMQKACREAMVHTSWTSPNEDYEAAVEAFVSALYAHETFLSDLEDVVSSVIERGRTNALAQTLIKLTAPGVPDLYQGTELWNLSLADPDNRRPIDFRRRRELLHELNTMSPEDVLNWADEGLPKLWVIRQALRVRHDDPEPFGPSGSYDPLPVRHDHAVAFARGGRVVTVVPRLWQADEEEVVTLPEGTWHNVLTGDEVAGGERHLAALLARFPVCLLVRNKGAA